jgi:tetratricopeptide (TPR) repeat protein
MKPPTTVWLIAIGLFLSSPLPGQEAKEQPVGLILASQGGSLVRANSELPLTARVGDVLYAGDALRAETGSLTFLFCPEKSSQKLDPGGEALLEAKQLRIVSGRVADKKPVEFCRLPQLERLPAASQQHYGGSMTRALEPAEAQVAFKSRVDELPEEQRNALRAELEPIDKALAADPKNQAARVARAALFEKYNLGADALEEYKKIADEWPDAVWVRSRIFVHEKEQGRAARSAATLRGGQTYALLVGISRFQRVPEQQWLRYAHQDAQVFEQYLRSPRGGALPDSNLVVLTNEKATTAAIRNAFETFLKARAGKNDTVVVFIAAHGIVEAAGRRGAYIITYDSDPEDLASTALPMADVQNLVREDLSKVGHVLVYVDVCRAGNIGALRGVNTVNKVIEQLAESEGDLFLFLASGPREYSYEGPQYGGGHGAFSYFLLDALNGEADYNRDGVVNVGEVIEHVREKVVEATFSRQHPRDLGSMERAVTVAEMRHPGITLARFSVPPAQATLVATTTMPGRRALETGAARPEGGAVESSPTSELDQAIDTGRILPDSPQNAFTALRFMQRRLTPEQYLLQQNKLRVALENQGQQVLLRYLSGDQTPQNREDFLRGAAYFEAARLLTPESLFLEGRAAFCNGRALLFEKDYRRAADLLEHAVRIDPAGAYSYNALGIAFLEQADYPRAIPAFRDAIRRAPYWAYPLHNLALTYTQTGDYAAAIRSYQKAMELAPQYSYLPYNLGLVYQRLNRRKEAEAAYRKAMTLAPNGAEPYNALGYLNASYGRTAEAERLYRQALEKNSDLLAARQNLAVLLAGKPDRVAEAHELWRLNLSKAPEYLPSRLSLARSLARQGQHAQAIQEYALVVKQKPDYVAARLALAELYLKVNNADAALVEFQEASKLQRENALIYEQIGDLERARNRYEQAGAAYQSALKYAPDNASRKRIRAKIRATSSAPTK